jgi:hypothetical protein
MHCLALSGGNVDQQKIEYSSLCSSKIILIALESSTHYAYITRSHYETCSIDRFIPSF